MNDLPAITEELERARNVLALMEQYKVPPTPDNYAVWYAYAEGLDADLVEAINNAQSGADGFTASLNAEFFRRFCQGDAQIELIEMGRRIEQGVTQVVEHLGVAVNGARIYGTSLENFSGELSPQKSPETMSSLVSDILLATRTMIAANTQLSQKLTLTVKEATQMKQDMEVLKREVSVDHLTKLYNRKWMDQVLADAMEEAKQEHRPLCLLMLDIDYFKKFNDTYGHQLGDQVLRLVAQTIVDSVEPADTAARYGGEEFAVILPNTKMAQAIKKAEAVRKRLANRKVTNRNTGKVLGQVTLSVGVSVFRPDDAMSDLIGRADKALYSAKNNGRNRVETEDETV